MIVVGLKGLVHMPLTSLSALLLDNIPQLISIIDKRIRRAPLSQYQTSVLETENGRARLYLWCEKLIKTLDEGPAAFFEFQRQISIERAEHGFQMEGGAQFYIDFLHAVWEVYRGEKKRGHANASGWQNDSELERLQRTCFEGLTIFSNAYLEARETQLNESLSYLDHLHQYTHDIIGRRSLGDIASLLLVNAEKRFDVEGCSLLINPDNMPERFNHPGPDTPATVSRLLASVMATGTGVFFNARMEPSDRIDADPLKRQVCVPLRPHMPRYGAFALYAADRPFRFTSKQLGILNQMLYITAVAIENCLMIREIKGNRAELQALTGKMMTLQEEERKRIATDIHDTIAQTLTGVSYQMQYCKELIDKDNRELLNTLDGMLQTVDRAIIQSRELISGLRPGLIDTVGLVPALHQLFDQFTRETGITIHRKIADDVGVSPESGICLYRVLQSALSNIYQHAGVKTATVKMISGGKRIHLIISDTGRGFDRHAGGHSFKGHEKFGLIGMKERVEAAGGLFHLKSAVNNGCRIHVSMPIAPDTLK